MAPESCSPSVSEVSSLELGEATSILSLLFSDCESVDLLSSGSSRAV